jgi:DhnA family fructose-bisphosphate aldolase class Ia
MRKIKNADTYTWSIPEGATLVSGSNTHSIVVDYPDAAISGNVSVYATNSCGDGTLMTRPVTIHPLPVPAISGLNSVCEATNSVLYSTEAGMTEYTWSVSGGGSISAGSTSQSVTVNWITPGAQWVKVNYTNTNGCRAVNPTQYNVTVNPLPVPAITGLNAVCEATTGVLYSTSAGMTTYSWTVSSGGTISGSSTTQSVTINWNTAGAQWVKVNYTNANGCRAANPTQYNVTVNPLPVPAITGLNSVCEATTGVLYSTTAGMTAYSWTVSAGGTISGSSTAQSVTINWNTAGAQWVKVNYTNANGCRAANPTQYNVTVNPLPVPAITGLNAVCEATTGVQYSTTAGMTAYSWTVSSGGTISGSSTGQTVTVNWNTAGAQWVKVNYTNTNGCRAANPTQYNVTVNPLPVPVITGLNAVCEATTGVLYSTTAGMTAYTWTVSAGGTISGSSTGQTVTVNWNTAGAQWVKLNYTNASGCRAVNPTQYNVTVNQLPVPVISGLNSTCVGTSGVVYSTSAGMTAYAWTVSSGGTITGSSTNQTVTVNWNTAGAQWIKVNYTNSSGCRATNPTQYNVTVNPFPAGAGIISGPASVCKSGNSVQYTISPIANASSYIWTLPPGATGNSSSNTINVIFGSSAVTGDITVKGQNSCGIGSVSSKNILVNEIPGDAGVITGETTVYQGQTDLIYSVPVVPFATSYNWILPAGVTGTSTTNVISLSFPGNAISGNISVRGHNDCNDGAPSFIFVNVYKQTEVKVFLEGLYAVGSQLMNMAQDENGNHFGTDVSDKIDVELRNSTFPFSIKYASYDLDLKTDGTCNFVLPSKFQNAYFIVVKNRNHVETWSATPVSFADASIVYDFTISDEKAFGNNMKQLDPGVYGIFTGDSNNDGAVDALDLIDLENDASGFMMGYVNTDLNGDGSVDALDMILADNNAAMFVSVIQP